MIHGAWEVEYTDEFESWWLTLDERGQEAVGSVVDRLAEQGTALGYPHSSQIKGARHGHMRELRAQCAGRPLRVFYAFDPRRSAILLLGGDKRGDSRFYERMVAVADRLYEQHLATLRREELI
jgi:hypothetical protein